MNVQDLRIKFFSNHLALDGILHLPETPAPPLVIGSHGLEGSKDSAKQRLLSRILPDAGIAYFRFDHRGCGKSQGSFVEDTSIELRARDIIDALQHLLSLGVTSRNIALFGSSMGGAACIRAWGDICKLDIQLRGLVICAAPLKSITIKNIPTQANGRRPALPLSFFARNLLFDLTDQARELSNILIFHGEADDVVPANNAEDIYDHALEPKQLIIQPGGDHQMSDPAHRKTFEKQALNWYLNCFKL